MRIRSRERGFFPGEHLVQCDECGKSFLRKHTMKRWDGAIVCMKDFERKHPQDGVRGRSDDVTVPIARPRTD